MIANASCWFCTQLNFTFVLLEACFLSDRGELEIDVTAQSRVKTKAGKPSWGSVQERHRCMFQGCLMSFPFPNYMPTDSPKLMPLAGDAEETRYKLSEPVLSNKSPSLPFTSNVPATLQNQALGGKKLVLPITNNPILQSIDWMVSHTNTQSSEPFCTLESSFPSKN